MALDDLEQRVIAEAAATGRRKENAPAADALAVGPHVSVRVRERSVAGVMRGPLFEGQGGELFQQQLIVPLIGRSSSRETGGINPGRAAKSFDRQAAVLAEHPLAQVPRLHGRLQTSIGVESFTRF